MAKIFTSYKFEDTSVHPLPGIYSTTVRDYVDLLQRHLDKHEHIDKGEDANEDLSHLSEERIAQLLYNRIYDSTITIVLISKNMKENKREKDQWIPREISYSLSEHSRGGRTSHTNAALAVVIPDENDSYEYFVQPTGCQYCNGITWKTSSLFEILKKNMFNRKSTNKTTCQGDVCGSDLHTGNDHSYIHPVKWNDFIRHLDMYLNHAVQINESIDDYDIKKEIA